MQDTLKTLRSLQNGDLYYSLPALQERGFKRISRLPVSIRIMLESLLRNCDGSLVKEEDVLRLAAWLGGGEVPFIVSRVLLQDFTGVPLLVDLAAMRDAASEQKVDPALIEPSVPVDLVIDHSVQVDRAGTSDALLVNLQFEFERNVERYAFLKWGESAFKTFSVVPPGMGIVHQINLEYLATLVTEKNVEGKTLLYFDTLVGTDSHTTMINGLGVVAWGVGGIEAQSAMLAQPVTIQMPEVIGVYLTEKLTEGVTATDLALRVTEMLRKFGVVDKFVEFFGPGVEHLTVADRATIANMAPEYGATMGFFPIDERTLDYLKMTGREKNHIDRVRDYLKAQGLFGVAHKGDLDFTKVLELDLSSVHPSVSGPKRPQDLLTLSELKPAFDALLKKSGGEGGYGKSTSEQVFVQTLGLFDIAHDAGGIENVPPSSAPWSETEMVANRPFTLPKETKSQPIVGTLSHGSIVIAAITSCTNTSNPFVMIAAGVLAKKAVEKGLRVNPLVKTSLAPGSRVVTEYLEKTDLQRHLDALGFQLVGYGCTTCIGNSGPLDERIEKSIKEHDLIVASVLSGNRNFEARIHSSVKANFLMSPPLVVAYALAGRVDIDLEKEPLGVDQKGMPVFLKDLWPSSSEIEGLIEESLSPQMFKERYAHIRSENPLWEKIDVAKGAQYRWDSKSTYIQKPPYLEGFTREVKETRGLQNMRALALFGDSVTTDHISPAGAIAVDSAAGKYLLSLGVRKEDFNSYGSRRGNHHVMTRGTFANVRIKNKMMEGKEGGHTLLMPEAKSMTIFEASQIYEERRVPLIVFAGKDYGMGSSRDWAAKGARLLGVKAVVAISFERIHRSNLIGMGILPLEFKEQDYKKIKGDELFSIVIEGELRPKQEAVLEITYDKEKIKIPVIVRLDTPIEIEYFRQGGIMPYVLRELLE